MKKVCLDILGCRALGDTLCATPTLKKLNNSYGNKISVITYFPELFTNNPYVLEIFNETKNKAINSFFILHSHKFLFVYCTTQSMRLL